MSENENPSDAAVVRGLIRASAGHDEGVTTQQVLVGVFGTLEESGAKDDGLCINIVLSEVAQHVGRRLWNLTLPSNGAGRGAADAEADRRHARSLARRNRRRRRRQRVSHRRQR